MLVRQKLDLSQHTSRGGDRGFARGRRRIAVAGAVEQADAEPLLDPTEPPECIGMVDAEPPRRRR